MFNNLLRSYVLTTSVIQRIVFCVNHYFTVEKDTIVIEEEKFDLISFDKLLGDPTAKNVPFYFPSKSPKSEWSLVFRAIEAGTIFLNYYTYYIYYPAPTNEQELIDTMYQFPYNYFGIKKPTKSPFLNQDDYLAIFLTEGPLYYLMKKNPLEDNWIIDFTVLSIGEFKENIYPYGGMIYLKKNYRLDRYYIEKIFYDNKMHYPTDGSWAIVYKIMIGNCLFTNTMLDHFSTLHSLIGNHFALATMNNLPTDNLLRLFLEPHIKYTAGFDYAASAVGFSGTNAFFFQEYAYKDITHIYKQIELLCERFDFASLNPKNHTFVSNKLKKNIMSIYNVINNYVRAGVNLAYPNIDMIDDPNLVKFIENLNELVPNGVNIPNTNGISKEELIDILSTFIYLVAVKHPADSTSLYNILPFFETMPATTQINDKPLSYMFTNFKFGLATLLFGGGKNNILDKVHSYVNSEHELSIITKKFIDELKLIELEIKTYNPIIPILPSELYASVSY